MYAEIGGTMMSKSSKEKTNDVTNRYWSGVFTGVFIGCFILSSLILIFLRVQGLKVIINPEQLAQMVRDKVQVEAKKDMPKLLEDFKKDLPQEIGTHLEVDQLKIGFGGSEVNLPEEITRAIENEFNRVIETAIINTLNSYDTGEYERKMAESAYKMVDQMLRREVIGKTYLIQSSKWFTVPVKIVSSTNKQVKSGL